MNRQIILLILAATVFISACSTAGGIPANMAHAGGPEKTDVLVFSDVNFVEGSIGLVFVTGEKKTVLFTVFADTVDVSRFYAKKHRAGEVIPEITARTGMRGKRFRVTHKRELREGDLSGMQHLTDVVTRIEAAE